MLGSPGLVFDLALRGEGGCGSSWHGVGLGVDWG